jgi:hypothetical protein
MGGFKPAPTSPRGFDPLYTGDRSPAYCTDQTHLKPTVSINSKKSTNPRPSGPPTTPNQPQDRRKSAFSKNSVQFSTTLSSNMANSQQPIPIPPSPARSSPPKNATPEADISPKSHLCRRTFSHSPPPSPRPFRPIGGRSITHCDLVRRPAHREAAMNGAQALIR